MTFTPTDLAGVFVVELAPVVDDRGFFARAFDPRAFAAQGLEAALPQTSLSFNTRRGTLRGMHFQRAPHEEVKLVRVVRGAIFDVALDLRPESPTRYRWVGVELSADNRRALYLPRGCAHGYQTLADDTEILYQMTDTYHPEAAGGVRWDDPAFAITWPLACLLYTSPSPRD